MAEATPRVSLAHQACVNLKRFEAEQAENAYNELVAVIQDVSSRGAIGLDICHYSRHGVANVTIRENSDNNWHKDFADTDINNAPVVNHKEIAERLEADGFQISYVTNPDYGKVIDTVTRHAE